METHLEHLKYCYLKSWHPEDKPQTRWMILSGRWVVSYSFIKLTMLVQLCGGCCKELKNTINWPKIFTQKMIYILSKLLPFATFSDVQANYTILLLSLYCCLKFNSLT